MTKEELKQLVQDIKEVENIVLNVAKNSTKDEKVYLKKIRDNFRNFISFIKIIYKQKIISAEELGFLEEIVEATKVTKKNMTMIVKI